MKRFYIDFEGMCHKILDKQLLLLPLFTGPKQTTLKCELRMTINIISGSLSPGHQLASSRLCWYETHPGSDGSAILEPVPQIMLNSRNIHWSVYTHVEKLHDNIVWCVMSVVMSEVRRKWCWDARWLQHVLCPDNHNCDTRQTNIHTHHTSNYFKIKSATKTLLYLCGEWKHKFFL